jgi:mannose-6-phosphate isomerase-like protein (cupin superfamily)
LTGHDLVLPPDAGQRVWLGGLGVRFILRGEETEGRFALIEHPLTPGTLAAPMHIHAHEDEFSFVLEGRVGMQLGDQTFIADPGTFVRKPRGLPHTFWNAGPTPARLLELISPAGFERYFEELGALVAQADLEALPALWQKYGLEMDMDSLPRLAREHGVNVGGPPAEQARGE